MNDQIPRRNRLDLFTPAEKAIWDAAQAVENLAAHPRLTDAVVLLAQAREAVADYVDGSALPPLRRAEFGPCPTGSTCLYSCVDACFRETRQRERDAAAPPPLRARAEEPEDARVNPPEECDRFRTGRSACRRYREYV